LLPKYLHKKQELSILTERFDKLSQKLSSMPQALALISADNMSVDPQQAGDASLPSSSSAQASASPEKQGNEDDDGGDKNEMEMSADTTMLCASCKWSCVLLFCCNMVAAVVCICAQTKNECLCCSMFICIPYMYARIAELSAPNRLCLFCFLFVVLNIFTYVQENCLHLVVRLYVVAMHL
jgi:hypothetical protein